MRKIILALAAVAGLAAFAAPAAASAANGPATVKAVIHSADHSDTSNLCGVGAIGTDCVWAHDNLSRQIVATPNGDGSWTVNITDNGSFAGFADPTTGAAMASDGPVKGSYQLTVTGGTPDAKNLPSQEPATMGTTAMINQLFGGSATVTGGSYSYSYQNGAYVQDTVGTGIHGDVRGH